MESLKIRPSVLAGSWYPDDPKELRFSIESYLARAVQPPKSDRGEGRLRGLILPHAGHRYSGQTCAAGAARIRGGRFSKIILMGPSHRTFVRGAAVSGASHFETPLGAVPVDRTAVEKLIGAGLPCSDGPHAKEHCLEIILPFFQVLLLECPIVPVLIGSVDAAARRRLVEQITPIVDKQTLLVASSDFVHYGADFDYAPDVGADARLGVRKIDEGAIDRISAMDADGLLEYQQRTGATICGILPIALLIDLLPKNCRPEFLDYRQSADVSGDTQHMVSYAAMAFYDV